MKKTMKKLLAFLMAFCLVVGIAMPGNNAQAASTSNTRYDGGYGIDEILSQFQFFVSGDVSLNNSGHTVGSIAVGGTLDMSNSFGDAGIVPSYINKLKNGYLGTGWHGQVPIKSNVVYFGTSANTINDGNWYQNAGYIDMAAAFDEIKKQSEFLAQMDDNKTVSLSNGALVIDLTGVSEDTYVNISYADFKAANIIDIKADSADWFSEHICLINVIGAGSGEVYYDGYSKIRIAGQSADTGIESMSGSDAEFNKQLNFSGMNLIWNFPDATGTVEIQGGLGGHLVAPNAKVNFVSGNYEGGVIAREISGGAEGHFYPMSLGLPKAIPAVTADATFSKKAVSADGTELAGASMKLTYVAGKSTLMGVDKKAGNNGPTIKHDNNKTITWKSNGKALELTGLPVGEYVLSETGAPDGYMYATDIAFKVDEKGKIYQKGTDGKYLATASTVLTMVDKAKSGTAVIKGTKRIIGQQPTPAEIYEFTLYKADKTTELGKVTRTGAGSFAFPAITYGPEDIGETFTYYVKETNGATANTQDSEYKKITVTVSEGATSLKTVVSGTAVVTNTYNVDAPLTPDATITVEKIASGSKLAGATLKLTYASGSKDLSDVTITGATNPTVAGDKYSMTWVTGDSVVVLDKLHPGEYVLSEVEAPTGYKLADDIMFKVVPPTDSTSVALVYLKNGDSYYTTPVTSITMTDEVKTGSAVIKGTKIISGDPIDETFSFVLTDENNNQKTVTTNGAGTFEFKVDYTAPGTYKYTVAEVAGTTSGMTYDTAAREITVEVNDNGGENLEAVVTGDLTITNKYKKQSTIITTGTEGTTATISKRAISADGAEVPGASMKLSYNGTGTNDLRHVTHSTTDGLAIEIIDNNKTVTWTSGTTPLVLNGLPDGEYVLTETAAPAGYEYASEMKFKIELGKVYQELPSGGYSTSPTPTIIMVDEAKGGSITLTGTKKITGESAASAPAETFNFVVMEGDTQVATGTANGAGNITFTEIKYEGATGVGKHTYTVSEVEPANKTENMFYSKAKLTVVVNVTDDGVKGSKLKAEIVAAESDAIEFTNKYTVPGNLIVTVYDEITKDIVPNADVEITDPQGEKTTYKTDENGQIKLDKIEPGDYYIETVKVPEGYTVSLGKTETATVVSKETTEHDVYITIPGKLIVTVYDEKTKEIVPGATVEITTPDGSKKEYKTDENGKIIIDNAQPGDYVVETVEVPSGYEVTLGKKETATVVSKKETTHDVYIDISTPGNLIVTVYDEKTKEIVPGATVEITDYTGVTKEYTTDETGKITINGLTPGKYEIVTTKVPAGYDVTLGKTETAMVEPGKTTSHDVYIGKDILGNLIVTVYDEKTKEVVPGATIKVTAPDGAAKEYTTDKNGKVTLNEIAAGDYKIETVKVPEGYTVTIGKVETAKVVAGKTASHDVYINTKSVTTTDTHVKTGDTANLKLTFMLMLVSAVGAVYVLSMKKKKC